MIVAFWSTVHGQSTTTSNTLAISIAIALQYRFKILLTHNHYSKSTLETSLFDSSYLKNKLTQLDDTGIDALSRFIKFNTVDSEEIANYTVSILRNRFDLLTGTRNINQELYTKDFHTGFESIIRAASKQYELIFLDVTSGNNKLSRKILELADVVVVCLNQNIHVLHDYFHQPNEELQKKAFYLLGMYDNDSKYNLSTIKRKYKIKNNIGVIPYCRSFADACNDGEIIDFFMKHIECKKSDSYYPFISCVSKSANILLKYLGYDLAVKKLGD